VRVPAAPSDSWSSGQGYESFVGRLSRQVAPEFLAWLGVPPGARWLDVGSVRDRLPIGEDGSIHLSARAWAVRGSVPRLSG
jgi:hypothetical protein